MFDKFFTSRKSALEKVLSECGKASQEGYDLANGYLKKVSWSIKDSQKVIKDCIDDFSRSKTTDDEIIANVKKQLDEVQVEFGKAYTETLRRVEEKRSQTANFNVTVFGRTEAGKSTLMEILTHGDGATMGTGSQRTTRDVKRYTWNGLTVTDVPGIEAFGGQEDEAIADGAAVYADLILFLVSTSNPGTEEAEWYRRLQENDKPIICVFNYFQAIRDGGSQALRDRAIRKIEGMKSDQGLNEAIDQFKKFLGGQNIEYVIVHLLSKFLGSRQKDNNLERVSNFDELERLIIKRVTYDGLLFRRKCYLSIVDEPIFGQMSRLFQFSTDQYDQFKLVDSKVREFEKWRDEFNKREQKALGGDIKEQFNRMRMEVPGFVAENAERNDVSDRWNSRVKSLRIDEDIQSLLSNIQKKCEENINDRFKELASGLNFSVRASLKPMRVRGGGSITDWKNIVGVTSGVAAAVLTGIALCGIPVVGWIAIGVGLVGGFFSWLFSSRESKQREQRAAMTDKLTRSINKMEYETQNNAHEWYKENIYKIQSDAYGRLRLLAGSLLSLANSERELALNYCANHTEISRKLVELALASCRDVPNVADKIVKVARVPAKRCVIVLKERCLDGKLMHLLKSKLGNGEEVSFIVLNEKYPLHNQANYLMRYFGLEVKCFAATINRGRTQVIYIPKRNYSERESDSILLTEQILNTHIIPKAYGEH